MSKAVSFLDELDDRHVRVHAQVETDGSVSGIQAEDIDTYDTFQRLDIIDRTGGVATVARWEGMARVEAAKR